MDLIIPNYFNVASSCSGHTYATYATSISPSGKGSVCTQCGYSNLTISGNLIAQIPVGTTKTISAIASMTCFRIAIGITPPTGMASWTQYTSVNQVSRSYTFSQTGLYTITISVRDISDSNSASNTAQHVFRVRVY